MYLVLFDSITKITYHTVYTMSKTLKKVEKTFISVKKDCFINSSVKLLISFTFHLFFDKQLSKIQKVLSGLVLILISK